MTGNAVGRRAPGKATIAGVMGAAAASAFIGALVNLEGDERRGYLDIAGIPTKCSGDTTDVVVGKLYSGAECRASTEQQALAHIVDVKRCTPRLEGNQLVAAGLLAYNIGGAKYCASTAARRFNAGDLRGGCAAFAPWDKARVRGQLVVVRGLANRRAVEMRICVTGLAK